MLLSVGDSLQLRGFLDSLQIELEFASSSESNGQVEKTHSTIIEIFNSNKQKFTSLNTADIIQLTVSLYNNSVHSATNFTPNEIVFNQTNTIDPGIIMTHSKEIFDKVICNLEKAKKKMEKNNEQKEEPPTIKEGNGVLIKKGVRKKLDPRFQMTTCLQNNIKTIKIGRNVKRNKSKLKRKRKNCNQSN